MTQLYSIHYHGGQKVKPERINLLYCEFIHVVHSIPGTLTLGVHAQQFTYGGS